MSKFNLSFRGEILPGYKPEQVKSRFAKLFAIDDPQRVEMFFSGNPVNLRRNLDRKEAADLFRKLHDIGLSSELVKVDEDGTAAAAVEHPATEAEAATETPSKTTPRGMDHNILQRAAGRVDQSWAVSSRKPMPANKSREGVKTEQIASRSVADTNSELRAREEAAAAEQTRIAEQEATRRKAGAEAAKAAAAEQARIAEQETARKKAEGELAKAAAAEQARIAEQEAARRKAVAQATIAAAEQKRIAEQEAARKRAEADAAKAAAAEQARIAEQDAARKRAEADAAKVAAAEQARIAEQEAIRRKAEAEAAKAAAAKQARIAEQEAARRKAEAEAAQVVAAEEQRIAEQDAARRKAEAAQAIVVEEQRIADQDAALRKAKAEAAIAAAEQARIAEQLAARKQAEAQAAEATAAEARRIAKEDAARKKAEADAAKAAAAQAKRIAKEDAARKKAEADAAKAVAAEARRVAREEVARSKAQAKELAAEAKRIAKDEAARKKTEENALRKAAAEAKRSALEEAAGKKAEEDAIRRAATETARILEKEAAQKRDEEEVAKLAVVEAKRLAAEQAERETAKVIRQAEQEEAIKKADSAKQTAMNEAARRLAAAEEGERLALAEEAKYLAAAEAARTRARAEHLKAEAAARMAAQEQSGTTDLFEDPTPPVAESTPPIEARAKSVAPPKALPKRLRTRIEVPTRVKIDSSAGPGDPGIKARRPSQPGAPNLFSILPFRNSTAVRERAQRSQTCYIGGLAASLLAVIALIALSLRFAAAPTPILLAGPDSIVASPAGQLLLLVNDHALSHDRSGVVVEEIILPAVPDSSARQPLQFISEEQYMLAAELTDLESEGTASQLLRCDMPENSCAPLLTDNPNEAVAGVIAHTLDGALYIANHRDDLLRKYSAEGKLLAEVSAAIPVVATLRLEDGLIYMNSSQGPAISVFRPDSTNFGTQLDEILLLTPVAEAAKFSKVRDFVRLSGFWWVILENVESGQARVFQFDSQWGYIREIEMAEGFNPQQLLSWGEKILIRDEQQSVIPRFNSTGEAEVSFESESLAALILEEQANAYTSNILWRISLALITAMAIFSCIFAYTHKIRSLVYKPGSTRGAEPIEDYTADITWLDPARNRRSRFLQLGILYLLGCIGAGAVAVGLGVSTRELFAVMIVLSGPIIGIILLYRSSTGNIGHSGETLVLVDHNKLYHIGRGPQIHYRNRFLIVGDVVVYIGASLLPTFDRIQLQQLIPLAEAGIKVDRKAVWIKLIQARHPLAMGTLVSLLCLSTAIVLLLL
ncbi:MAG: hypothetical protein V7696_11950 [Halioglobus sp.]